MNARRLATIVLTLGFLLALSAPAFAAGPVSIPTTVTYQAFETTPTAPWTLGPASGIPSPTAYWGCVTGITGTPVHGGAKALWCGGTLNPSKANYALSHVNYKVGTRGEAMVTLDLRSYYSSNVQFYYHLRQGPPDTSTLLPVPDMGAGDSFAVGWTDGNRFEGYIGAYNDLQYFPISEGWTLKRFDMATTTSTGSGGANVNMSRKSGYVYFDFTDTQEGPYTAHTVGQGLLIDDVLVSGYKYGPVRSTAATLDGAVVHLSWRPPLSAVGSSLEDTRPIAYRVWRSYDSSPTDYREITTVRSSATSTDVLAPALPSHYFVQAWDTGAGAGYGEPPTLTAGVSPFPDGSAPRTTIATSAGEIGGWYKGSAQFSLAATDEAGNDVTTFYRVNGSPAGYAVYTSPVTVTTEGVNTVDYFSMDQSLNTEPVQHATIRVDKTPPSTTATMSGTTLTLTPADSGSGVARTRYTLNGGATLTYTTPVDLAGVYGRVGYWSEDNVGNIETSHTIQVDGTAPRTTITTSAGEIGGWYKGSAQFSLAATDEPGNVIARFYRVNGSPAGYAVYATPVTVTAEGTNTVDYYSQDQSMNVEPVQHATIRVDKTPPSTTATMGGTVLTLTPVDSGSGVARTRYMLNGGATLTYTTPVDLAGLYGSVDYWSEDNVGNVEASHTIQFDETAPRTTITTSAGEIGGWYKGSAQFSLATTDEAGNLISRFYRVNGLPAGYALYTAPVTVATEGVNTVDFYSRDQALNVEPVQHATIRVDRTPPSTTLNAVSSEVTLSATDSGSGVAATYYTVDGGETQQYNGTFGTGAGLRTVEYWSVDVVGNVESAQTAQVNGGSITPTTTITLTPGAVGGWYKGSAAFSLAATGDPALAISTFYRINGVPAGYAAYTTSVPVTSAGTNTVDYFSQDASFTTEPTRQQLIKIDAAAPSSTATIAGATVTVSVDDTCSGVGGTYYRLDGGAVQTYAGPFSGGGHVVTFWSVDNVGNVEATRTLDMKPPNTPSGFAAYSGNGRADLVWKNPASDFYSTRILRSTSGYAASATSAGQSLVYEGTASSRTQTGLSNGVTYYYTAFARDAAGNWSGATKKSVKPAKYAALSTPALSTSTPRHGVSLYFKGTVTAHASKTSVTVYVYRKVGGISRLAKTLVVSVPAGATAYKTAWYKFAYAGSWSVRTYHKDTNHPYGNFSAYRSFTVR